MIGRTFRFKSGMNDLYESIMPSIPIADKMLTPFRANLILRRFRKWREHYENLCSDRNLSYSEQETIQSVRRRLAKRGYTPSSKQIGTIHTYAFIPRTTWHSQLLDDLHELGRVSEFDYVSRGYTTRDLYMAETPTLVNEMNASAFEEVLSAHREEPIDWIFMYASGAELSPAFVRRIVDEIGVPMVLMSLDDKQSWDLGWIGRSHRRGQIDLTPCVDISWTTSRTTCGWHLSEGGRPLLQPEGTNANIYFPRNVPRDIEVSFVGQRYGFRSGVIRELSQHGLTVATFGKGWETNRLSSEKLPEIYCRSNINLGMGGIGFAEYLTNVKGRDFDVPCAGGGVYITSFNPDLATHFEIGKEIVCYGSRDELIELVRHYLKNGEEGRSISARARTRCLQEHRWLHRYIKICQVLGIIDR